ncbi:MAG: tetratricopeptide repeat protein [Verrucomicrobiota bacterium]
MRRNLIICLLLAGITLAVYWPVGGYDYVRYDDPLFFVENPEVQSGLTGHSVLWALTGVVAANWHPVTSLSFVVTHQLFGTNAHAEHWVNVAFHCANAVLLFLVLLGLTGTVWRCAVVAAVFALHPLRVESVAWIAERKDVLCAFFFMLTLLCYARYAQKTTTNRPGGETFNLQPSTFNRPWSYWLAVLCFALGLMSKAMVVTLPFVLLLLDVWPLKRVTGDWWQVAGSKAPGEKPSTFNLQLATLLFEKWPFFALSAVFSVITFWVQKNSAAVVSLDMVGFNDRIGHSIVSYLQYLVKLFWPARLAIIYPYSVNEWPAREIWLTALLLVAVTAWCVCLSPRKPYLAMGWFWYLGTAVPIIGLVQVGETAMADRYTYIPLIGPVIALVWLVSEKWQRETFQKVFLGFSAVVLLAGLGGLTRRQVHYWKNTVSLFEHAVAVTGSSYSAHNGLAIGLEHAGRAREAMVHYRIAMALNPRETQNCKNMAQMLIEQGKWNEAAQLESAILEIEPNDSTTHLNLAVLLQRLDRNEEARQQLELALQIKPDATEVLNNLAWTLATGKETGLRDGNRAVQLAERACELTHYEKTIYLGTLAAAYAEAGRFDEAVATAQKACALAEAAGEKDLLQKNRELLELYRSHQPYRDVPAQVVPAAP